jgi:hypothetical protein
VSSTFAKRVRRELTKNPKKAGALGLLVVVALYFWAPLVWQWVAPASSTTFTATQTTDSQAPPPGLAGTGVTNKTSAKKNAPPSHPWQQVVRWREQDPHTMTTGRDPVQRSKPMPTPVETAEATRKEEEAAKLVWSPESLGLEVSSTIVGTRRSVALINGRAYRQGDTIELAKDGRSLTLTLAEIHPGRIVLHGMDQPIELTIPEREATGRFEMLGSW